MQHLLMTCSALQCDVQCGAMRFAARGNAAQPRRPGWDAKQTIVVLAAEVSFWPLSDPSCADQHVSFLVETRHLLSSRVLPPLIAEYGEPSRRRLQLHNE